MKKLSFLSLMLIITVNAICQTGPAGVGNSGNNPLWFDAFQLALTNNSLVSNWNDISGNSNVANQSSSIRQPRFLSNQINGFPIVSFDGNDLLNTGSISDLNTGTISWFIVGQSNGNSDQWYINNSYLSGGGTTWSNQLWGTFVRNTTGETSIVSRTNNNQTRSASIGIQSGNKIMTGIWNNSTGIIQGFLNGSLTGTASGANANPTGHNFTRIGCTAAATNQCLTGRIAEIIVFSSTLNTTQRIIVENYLSSKYNLPNANDFYAHENTHLYEVFGIGQLNPSDNHTDAQGQGIVRINNPSNLNDNEFLLIGHNNLSTNLVTNVPAGLNSRIDRSWRAGQSGNVGTVTLSFDLTGIAWAADTSYRLLIDTDQDGDFSNATAINSGMSFNPVTNILTFNSVSLNDGDYFTIGSSGSSEIISIISGDWNSPATWNCNCIPGTSASVTIDDTHTVSISSNQSVANITINPTGTLSFTAPVTLNITGEDGIINNGTFNAGTGTVIYSGASSQTIGSVNYFNLSSTGAAPRILSSSGSIGIAGTFTPGINPYTNTGSTINYNGSSTQTITKIDYFNLTISNTGSRNLPDTLRIASTFNPGTNTYNNINGSVIIFNGSGTQTIPAFNYHHLISTNSGARILSPSGVIGIAGVFNKGTNSYTTSGSTVDYNGSGAQTITQLTYHNLTSSNTGGRTISIASPITITGLFTPGTNTYTQNTHHLIFSNTSSQFIPSFQYHNIDFGGTGLKILDSSNPILIRQNFRPYGSPHQVTGSTIVFNGTSNQSIVVSGSSTFTFNNLTINKSSGTLSISSGNVNLRGILDIQSATNFNTNGRPFTMISDATSTAAIAPVLNGGSITGNFIIQRFVPAGNNNWMTMTAPIVSSTLADWDNELFLSGIGGNEGFFPGPPFYSVYEWNETAQDYAAVTTTTATLQAGKGFEVWMCGSNPDIGFTRPNTIFNSVANPYIGSLNIPLSFTAGGDYPGRHLVGNPYPAHLNLNSLTGNIADEFYIFDDDIGEAGDYYAMWDKASQTGTGDLATSGGVIAPHQGFWVTANAPTTLGFTESMKTSSTSSSSWVGKQELPELAVRINKQNSPKGSRAFVRFNDVSTKNFDEFDSQFRLPVPPNIPSISILTDGNKKLIVNSVNEDENLYALPLAVKSGTQGIYQLSVDKKNITNGYNCYMIEDTKLNKMVNVSNGAYYEVALNNNEKIDNRFILHISKDDCPANEAPSGISANSIDNKVGVFGHEQGAVVVFGYNETVNANISVYNTLGQLVSQPLNQNISSDRVILNLPSTTQVYIIRVEVNGEVLTQRIVR